MDRIKEREIDMQDYPLHFRSGLMFLDHGGLWLLDSGSPSSFSERESLELEGRGFELAGSLMGFNAEKISDLVGFEVAGLLGTDVMNELDWLFDLPAGRVTVSTEPLPVAGPSIELDGIMGVPVIPAEVGGKHCQVILDTGAELSYFPVEFFDGLAPNGRFHDFNPVLGAFDVDVYCLEARIAGLPFNLRSATIPENFGLLRMAFQMAGAHGLLGIQVFQSQPVLYAPRQERLAILSARARTKD
ncbi:MAG: hypothetical protein ACPL7M_01600 [Bryobacteraceae bacterium]